MVGEESRKQIGYKELLHISNFLF